MKNWKKTAVSPDTTIKDVLSIIDKASLQIALVIDESECLLGTVTDGDVRRGILKGVGLDATVETIYKRNPIVAHANDDFQTVREFMKREYIRQLPILDKEGRVVRLEILKEFFRKPKHSNPVIIMAGGLGTRLKPLTETCPKPLLKVGGKPILKIILENFIEYGFCNFFISVHYKAQMIQKHIGDGSDLGVNITYLREDKRLGTAGSLSLLPKNLKEPFLIINGDLLTKVNFQYLLEFHQEHQACATMCVREYQFQVPYGVVSVDGDRLTAIDEKPVHTFFINAGIYALDPGMLDIIPKNIYYDMTDLFDSFLKKGFSTSVFPIREYWLDIGRMQDFKQANEDCFQKK